MKKMFRKAIAAMMLALVAVAVLTSCGKDKGLESSIPANAKWIVKIDMTQLIDNAGGKVDSDGTITLPQTDAVSPLVRAMAEQVLPMIKEFDLSAMYLFEIPQADVVMVAAVRDMDAAINQLKTYLGEPTETDGFKTLSLGGDGLLAFKDNKFYFSEDINNIKAAVEAANDGNISKYPAIASWLAGDALIACAVSPAEMELPANFADYWMVGQAALKDNSATGELTLMDVDGKRYAFGEAFGEVSTDFLRYIPDNAQCVAALGKVESPEIAQVLRASAAQLGDMGQLITALDGTVALSVATDSTFDPIAFSTKLDRGHFDPAGLEMIAMLHYPQQTINFLVNTMNDNARSNGEIPGEGPNGLTTMTLDGTQLYYGGVDGYFSVANYPIMGRSQNSYAPLVSGTRGVIAGISEPQANPYGFNYGSKGRIWLTSDAIKGEVTITNTSKKFMEVIIEVLSNPQVQQQIIEAMASDRDMSFGGYDDDEDFFVDVEEDLLQDSLIFN